MMLFKGVIFLATLLFSVSAFCQENFRLSENGKTDYTVILAADASAQEKFAAEELASYLEKISGARFQIKVPGNTGDSPVIAVGSGAASYVDKAVAGEIAGLGQEGILIKASGKNIILTGGPEAMRGTIYSVYTFLEDFAGVRWWTDKVTYIPSSPSLDIKLSPIKYTPKFEYREIFIYCAYDNNWQIHNKCNGGNMSAAGPCSSRFKPIPQEKGGCLVYRGGFAHTMPTVFVAPTSLYFKEHPEWFAEINGKRKDNGDRSQLCLSNKELLAHFIKKVRELLAKSSAETIVSVTQGDSPGTWRCQCKECKKIEEEEGSGSGPVIRFVNAIADDIKNDYPEAKIDTFAYIFTRKPCKTSPRDNVIIRLADIEGSFSKPLYDDVNKGFDSDLKGWAAIAKKIYIWDYITNFSNYVYPFPNLRVMGPNLKFLSENNVKGVFEQGSFQSYGGEFSELRAWVLAKLLWNPELDSNKLIDEFLAGYYGKAAPFIKRYINLLHDEIELDGTKLGINDLYIPPLELLINADETFNEAEKTVTNDPEILKRVHSAHLPVIMALLINYPRLKQKAVVEGKDFRTDISIENLFREFVDYGKEAQLAILSETNSYPPSAEWPEKYPLARKEASAPAEFTSLQRKDWYDLQDNMIQMHFCNMLVFMEKDDAASDGYALRMPATHNEWAVQALLPEISGSDDWEVYAAVKVIPGKRKDDNKPAFTAGIYDPKGMDTKPRISIKQKDISASEYKLYKIGSTKLDSGNSLKVWVAPCKEKEYFDSVWVDRIFLVRNKK